VFAWEMEYYILKAWNLCQANESLNAADNIAMRVIRHQSIVIRQHAMADFIKKSNLSESFMTFAERILDVKGNRQIGLGL